VGVSAELGEQAGVRLAGEVGGHDGHCAAIEAEGRSRHALVLDRDERLDARAFDGEYERERVGGAGGCIEGGMRLAGDLVARMQAEGARLFAAGSPTRPVAAPRLVQGAIEDSNVQPIAELNRMTDDLREFQFTTQIIQAESDRQNGAIDKIMKKGM